MEQTIAHSRILALLGLLIFFWPLIVSSSYLVLRWGAVRGKVSFWFIASLAGYALMYGIPLLAVLLINLVWGPNGAADALANPSLKWLVRYYWAIMAVLAFILVLFPVWATHSIFKRRYANT